MAAYIAQNFPEVVETYSLLDSTVRSFLNQDNALHLTEVEPIITRIEHHLHDSGSSLLKRAFSPMDLKSLICLDEGNHRSSQEVTDTIDPVLLDNTLPKETQAL